MKTKSAIFKIISCLLTLMILTQSCTIYRSSGISVDEAIESKRKVRVKTNLDKSYTFKRIERDDADIYGITTKNSKAAKDFYNDIYPESLPDNLVKVKLTESAIEEINLHNKTLSVLVPLLVVGTGILIFALTYEVQPNPLPHGI